MTRSGVTRNISSGGVLFVSGQAPELGGLIEYIITLDPNAGRRVDIRCVGRVVRCGKDPGDSADSYEIAATLERYEFLRMD